MRNEKVDAFDAGADDVIEMPVNVKILKAKICSMLKETQIATSLKPNHLV